MPILLAKGITTIHAEYHGFADEGMFDGISYEPQLTDKRKIADMQKLIDNPPSHRPNEENTKIVTVSNFLFAIVAQKFPGFENEEGGQGELTWNIEKDEININHEQNVVMTNRTIMRKSNGTSTSPRRKLSKKIRRRSCDYQAIHDC